MDKSKITTKRVVLVSFIVNILDIVTNLVVVVLTGSAVIFAELMQGVSDSIGSFFLLIGYKRSIKVKDATHPFGYGREAFFWTLLSALVMLLLGSGFSIVRGYSQLINPKPIDYPILVFIVLCLSTTTNGYAFYQSVRKIKLKDHSMLRSWKLSRNQLVKTSFLRDSLGTLAAVFGLSAIVVFELTGNLFFDGIGAIAIGLLVLIFSLILITQSRHLITGESVSKELLARIRKAVVSLPEIVTINNLYAVYSGTEQILVDADLDIKDSLKTTDIEKLYDKVQSTVIKAVPEVRTVRINLNSSTDKIAKIA